MANDKTKKTKSCDCLQKATAKIIEFVKKNMERDGVKVAKWNEEDSGYVNRVLTFGGDGGWKLMLPFELKYTPLKANGEHGKERAYKTSIFPAFCPFCGKSQSSE